MQDKILKGFRDYYEIYSKNPELVIVHPETFYDIIESTFSSNIAARGDGLYIEGSVVKKDPCMEKDKMVLTCIPTKPNNVQDLGKTDSWMLVDLWVDQQ